MNTIDMPVMSELQSWQSLQTSLGTQHSRRQHFSFRLFAEETMDEQVLAKQQADVSAALAELNQTRDAAAVSARTLGLCAKPSTALEEQQNPVDAPLPFSERKCVS